MIESKYQAELIDRLKNVYFPGCIVLKNDTDYQQGIPDLTVLYGRYWAFLEVKRSENSRQQPNQEYFVDLADSMSFGSFISPETEEAVIYELQLAFGSRWSPRLSQRK